MADLPPVVHVIHEFADRELAALESIAKSLAQIAEGGGRVASGAPAPSGGATFPPYGKSAGGAVAGATLNDLRFYAHGCVRSIENPDKVRFHAKERALLAAINAEITRQGGAPIEPAAPAAREPDPPDPRDDPPAAPTDEEPPF